MVEELTEHTKLAREAAFELLLARAPQQAAALEKRNEQQTTFVQISSGRRSPLRAKSPGRSRSAEEEAEEEQRLRREATAVRVAERDAARAERQKQLALIKPSSPPTVQMGLSVRTPASARARAGPSPGGIWASNNRHIPESQRPAAFARLRAVGEFAGEGDEDEDDEDALPQHYSSRSPPKSRPPPPSEAPAATKRPQAARAPPPPVKSAATPMKQSAASSPSAPPPATPPPSKGRPSLAKPRATPGKVVKTTPACSKPPAASATMTPSGYASSSISQSNQQGLPTAAPLPPVQGSAAGACGVSPAGRRGSACAGAGAGTPAKSTPAKKADRRWGGVPPAGGAAELPKAAAPSAAIPVEATTIAPAPKRRTSSVGLPPPPPPAGYVDNSDGRGVPSDLLAYRKLVEDGVVGHGDLEDDPDLAELLWDDDGEDTHDAYSVCNQALSSEKMLPPYPQWPPVGGLASVGAGARLGEPVQPKHVFVEVLYGRRPPLYVRHPGSLLQLRKRIALLLGINEITMRASAEVRPDEVKLPPLPERPRLMRLRVDGQAVATLLDAVFVLIGWLDLFASILFCAFSLQRGHSALPYRYAAPLPLVALAFNLREAYLALRAEYLVSPSMQDVLGRRAGEMLMLTIFAILGPDTVLLLAAIALVPRGVRLSDSANATLRARGTVIQPLTLDLPLLVINVLFHVRSGLELDLLALLALGLNGFGLLVHTPYRVCRLLAVQKRQADRLELDGDTVSIGDGASFMWEKPTEEEVMRAAAGAAKGKMRAAMAAAEAEEENERERIRRSAQRALEPVEGTIAEKEARLDSYRFKKVLATDAYDA